MKLDRAANLAILVVCGLLAIHLAKRLYGEFTPDPRVGDRMRAETRATKATVGLAPGDVIADTPDLRLANSAKTIILVTMSSCRFCTDSMPFYRRLSESARQRRVQVVAAAAEHPRLNETYLSINGVTVERIVSASDNKIITSGTPTLVLVERSVKILKVWRGRLPKAEEQVMRAVAEP
jgi:hypothetical protein